MGTKRAFFPGAALLALFLWGCRIFPEWETLDVRPPSPLPVWSECGLDPAWELLALWPGGSVSADIPAGGAARVSLPRGETTAILAYPVEGGRRLRPAGAVLRPGASFGGKVRLTWEGGYQAESARILLRAGEDPSRFDLERFLAEALARLPDPWVRPPEAFAPAFAEGRFRVVWLDPPEAHPASVSGLPGRAASESPFGAALEPDEGGKAVLELPAGFHRWYAGWGRVSVEVREDGSAVWIVLR